MPWMNGKEFEAALNKPLGGTNTVHLGVHDAVAPGAVPEALMTGGGKYTPMPDPVVGPPILCPCCNTKVEFLDVSKAEYEYPKDAVLYGVIPGLSAAESVRFKFKLNPCGHWVDSDWAGAFTQEINNRNQGLPAKATIQALTSLERVQRIGHLQKRLEELRKAMDALGGGSSSKAVQYRIITTIDQLKRIEPEALIPPMHLHEDVTSWAFVNGYPTPPTMETLAQVMTDHNTLDFKTKPGATFEPGQTVGISDDGYIVPLPADSPNVVGRALKQGSKIVFVLDGLGGNPTEKDFIPVNPGAGYSSDYKPPKGMGTALDGYKPLESDQQMKTGTPIYAKQKPAPVPIAQPNAIATLTVQTIHSLTRDEALHDGLMRDLVKSHCLTPGSVGVADEVERRFLFIKNNMFNHLKNGETLAEVTVKFITLVSTELAGAGAKVVAAAKPGGVTVDPLTYNSEKFHEQFRKRKRRIRPVD